MMIEVRDARPGDVPAFYAMHADPEANRRGAFTPRKRADFFKHWAKVLKNRLILKKTVLHNGKVAGYVVSFYRGRRREIGYWVARRHWGKGLASEGLRLTLENHHARPLFARVAKTNPASKRVVEKCGFRVVKENVYENEAGKKVEEYVLKLTARRPR